MRVCRPLTLVLVVAPAIAIGACNLVTGATDLQVASENDTTPIGGGVRDGAVDQASTVTGNDGGSTKDASVDARIDAADAGCGTTSATTLLGTATPLLGFYQLTTNSNGLAGGIASATPIPIDDFDASFSYSITYTGGLGAGLGFFAITESAKALSCQPGPPLCTLGASAPGFAVILRTSKGNAGDPDVPYVTVVDAQSYPSVQPVNPPLIDPTKAYTSVSAIDNATLPPQATFHTMAISARSGKVSVTIDGGAILSGVPIPNWSAGRVSTWGVGAATGIGSGFAERTVVGPVTFNRCPKP